MEGVNEVKKPNTTELIGLVPIFRKLGQKLLDKQFLEKAHLIKMKVNVVFDQVIVTASTS